MNHFFRTLLVGLAGLLIPVLSLAQLTMPVSRIVFQRGNDNRASVLFQGNCPSSATSFQVKVTALNGGNSVDWTTIGSASNGVFSGTLSLVGGGIRFR